MKSKFVSIICIITLLFSSVSYAVVNADAGNYETKDDFVYEKGTNNIVAYIGKTGICEIPENVQVTNLYDRSNPSAPMTKLIVDKGVEFNLVLSGELQQFDSLKEVELKEGVTEIPYQAFEQCKSLEKITIPSTVTQIGDYALSNCKSLKTVELPNGLISIGEYAFSYLPALSGDINVPDSVTSMGENAFSMCGDLNKVHLSDNLTYTPTENYNGSESFAGWFSDTNVNEINIPKAMLDRPTCYFQANEITFDSDMTVNIYKAVENSAWCREKYLKGKTDISLGGYDGFAVAENTVLRYIGADKNPTVPEDVTAIGVSAFSFCDIDTVTLPDSLKKIGNSAFYWSTLKTEVIPKNVKTIGDNAFDGCALLEKITFNSSPEIGDNAVVVSNNLTEDNIIVPSAASKLKEQILSNGTAEYSLSSFYKTLNKRRADWGLDEVAEEYSDLNLPVATQAPVSTVEPQTTASPMPTSSILPTNTPSDTVDSDKLSVHGGDEITVKVNGKNVVFPDAKPFVDNNDRTQVPIRAVSEMLNCKVDWDEDTKTATIIRKNGDVIKMTLDSDMMTVNNKLVQMDTAVMIKEDRTYIPVRFIGEALGLEVEWVE